MKGRTALSCLLLVAACALGAAAGSGTVQQVGAARHQYTAKQRRQLLGFRWLQGSGLRLFLLHGAAACDCFRRRNTGWRPSHTVAGPAAVVGTPAPLMPSLRRPPLAAPWRWALPPRPSTTVPPSTAWTAPSPSTGPCSLPTPAPPSSRFAPARPPRTAAALQGPPVADSAPFALLLTTPPPKLQTNCPLLPPRMHRRCCGASEGPPMATATCLSGSLTSRPATMSATPSSSWTATPAPAVRSSEGRGGCCACPARCGPPAAS